MTGINHFFVTVCLLLINFTLLTTAEMQYDDDDEATTLSSIATTSTEFNVRRYDRYFFFFLADTKSINLPAFQRMLYQLIALDDYCGGETVRTTLDLSNHSPVHSSLFFHSLEDFFISACLVNALELLSRCYINSFVSEANASSENINDTGQLTETLINSINQMWLENEVEYDVFITKQVILITDFVTQSLRNESIINTLLELKAKRNITFISLNKSLLDDKNISDYFPEQLWNSYTDYLRWPDFKSEINNSLNPLCDYKMDHYTTPSPSFGGDLILQVYLFLSRDNMKKMKSDIIELLRQLASRRWQYPCTLRHIIYFDLYIAVDPSADPFPKYACLVEDIYFDHKAVICSRQIELWTPFSAWLDEHENITYTHYIPCIHYDYLFDKIRNEPNLKHTKYLLITDLPMSCPNSTTNISAVLHGYYDYASGAPFTVIAIDRANDKSVYNSFSHLFPPTQAPNLYGVNSISDLLPDMNKTINFCLHSVPLLSWFEVITLPKYHSLWYLYLIGGIILLTLLVTLIIFIKRRNGKRNEKLRHILERMRTRTVTMENNQYICDSTPSVADIWEISQKSLDILNKAPIGKGAFSVVQAGFLKGRAPILDIYPSIALQDYVDCDVAVKTLPHHFDEIDKERFLSEINLMKDIGYHIHVVSMLGSNCSTVRPFLVLELAEESLLHWLIHMNSSMSNAEEFNLEKTLLSLSWQISDGMSYLSSKHFFHRDLAARNVLLNKDLRAMISDFGLCQKLDDAEQVIVIQGGKLPLKWMALESLLEQKFSTKTDVWSFGVLLYEMYCLGKEPYGNVSSEELLTFLREGKRPEQPKIANEHIYELMKQCWHADVSLRPNFDTIQNILRNMLEDSTEKYGYLPTKEIDVD